jgi:hypothetical protein
MTTGELEGGVAGLATFLSGVPSVPELDSGRPDHE